MGNVSKASSNTAQKTKFSFSKCYEKMVFPKKLHWNMIFLILLGKISFFPQNMILLFRWKKKDDLSQKIDVIWCFLQMIWKDGLSKKITFEYDLFCNIWKDIISFFPKIWKWKMIFLKWYMEIWYFLYICINVTNMILLFCQKSKDNLLPKKYT